MPATGGPQETRRDGGRGWARSSFCSALVVWEVWGLGEDAWGKQGRRLGPGLNLLLFSREKGGANTSSLPVESSQKRGEDSPKPHVPQSLPHLCPFSVGVQSPRPGTWTSP